jgi:RNA polymerase sigma factor (sigma-70 family)
MTELNDHLKLLFARAAQLFDKQTAQAVRHDTPETIHADLLAKAAAAGDPRLVITFPVELPATVTPAEVAHVAERLNVKPEEVVEMETRLSGGDVALEPQNDDGEESFAPIAYLADDTNEPTHALEARHRDWLSGDGIHQALEVLDARSRRVVEERWLKVNDDSSGGMTLHELAADYGVSAERIRQIEVAALKKMRKALEAVSA